MAEIATYRDGELPAELACQILSFVRIEWQEGFTGDLRLRDWIHRPAHHPIHFVLSDHQTVISYAGVLWKDLEHAGATYKTYGLSGVFTYPSFRRQGHGRAVVAAATRYIASTDADIGLFTCNPTLRSFYGEHGWLPMDGVTLFGGPKSNPRRSNDLTVMGFFSDKGVRARPAFESQPIYFDDDPW